VQPEAARPGPVTSPQRRRVAQPADQVAHRAFLVPDPVAPILLTNTRMIALLHERLARTMAHQTSRRLLEPPIPLLPINQLMLWNAHAEADPAHQWLRQQLMAMAAELDRGQPEPEPTRPGTGQGHQRGPNMAGLSFDRPNMAASAP